MNHDSNHTTETKSGFLTTYLFSQDHKMIGIQFLFSGLIFFGIGGLLALLIRLQLAWPDGNLPYIGKWFPQSWGGKMSPEFYTMLFTMHASIMIFFVIIPWLTGTFGNFLIPLMIGARDMASGFLNMLSYWMFFLSSTIMVISMFIETGPAMAGWTIYPPLSALGDASSGSKIGMDLWLVSMAMFIVSSLLGGLNYITTILNMRTKGMSMTRMPLTIWALFFTAVLGVLSFPVLLPIILVVIHLSKQAIDGIEWAGLGFDFLVILTALNILTIALSFILFPYLWRD